VSPINYAGQEFIIDLGHRISAVTEDPRESCFCSNYALNSVALQRFNAVFFTHAFEQEQDVFHNQPGDTKRFTYTLIINNFQAFGDEVPRATEKKKNKNNNRHICTRMLSSRFGIANNAGIELHGL
jgi:hypothetical protein